MIGPAAERGNVVRKGMRAIQSLIEAEVPVVTIHVRKAYGMAVSATANPDGLCLRLAWPSAEWGDMPIEGGVEAGYRREIEASPDPQAFRREVEQRLLTAADHWKTVAAFGVESMIDPRETRGSIPERKPSRPGHPAGSTAPPLDHAPVVLGALDPGAPRKGERAP